MFLLDAGSKLSPWFTIGQRLLADGHSVVTPVLHGKIGRNVAECGIECIVGGLYDPNVLRHLAEADAVIDPTFPVTAVKPDGGKGRR